MAIIEGEKLVIPLGNDSCFLALDSIPYYPKLAAFIICVYCLRFKKSQTIALYGQYNKYDVGIVGKDMKLFERANFDQTGRRWEASLKIEATQSSSSGNRHFLVKEVNESIDTVSDSYRHFLGELTSSKKSNPSLLDECDFDYDTVRNFLREHSAELAIDLILDYAEDYIDVFAHASENTFNSTACSLSEEIPCFRALSFEARLVRTPTRLTGKSKSHPGTITGPRTSSSALAVADSNDPLEVTCWATHGKAYNPQQAPKDFGQIQGSIVSLRSESNLCAIEEVSKSLWFAFIASAIALLQNTTMVLKPTRQIISYDIRAFRDGRLVDHARSFLSRYFSCCLATAVYHQMSTRLPISPSDMRDSVFQLLKFGKATLPIHTIDGIPSETHYKYAPPKLSDARKLSKVLSITLLSDVSTGNSTTGLRAYRDITGRTYTAKELALAGFFEMHWTPGMHFLHFFFFEYLGLPISDDLLLALLGKKTDVTDICFFSWANLGPYI